MPDSIDRLATALANHYTTIAFAGAAPGRYMEFVDLAMEAANKTIELDPDFEGGYSAQAHAHWRAGNIEEMKRSLRKALQINPNYTIWLPKRESS